MFLIAAIALAELSPTKLDVNANLLPDLKDIHKVAKHIAFAVAKEAVNSGLSEFGALSDLEIKQYIDEYYWIAKYLPFKRKPM